jgi:opacity protein-like surface antigen
MDRHVFAYKLSSLLIAGGLLAAAPLKAEDAPHSGLRWGGMVSVTSPKEELSSGANMTATQLGTPGTKAGFGISLFAEKYFSQKTVGRLRFDYLTFGKKTVSLASGHENEPEYGYSYVYELSHKGSANAVSVMADWVYRFDSNEKGPFVFAGAGLLNTDMKYAYREYERESYRGDIYEDDETKSKSKSSFGLAVSAGIGYYFSRNFAAEVKYTTAFGIKTNTIGVINDYELGLVEKSISFDWIQLSISYRF